MVSKPLKSFLIVLLFGFLFFEINGASAQTSWSATTGTTSGTTATLPTVNITVSCTCAGTGKTCPPPLITCSFDPPNGQTIFSGVVASNSIQTIVPSKNLPGHCVGEERFRYDGSTAISVKPSCGWTGSGIAFGCGLTYSNINCPTTTSSSSSSSSSSTPASQCPSQNSTFVAYDGLNQCISQINGIAVDANKCMNNPVLAGIKVNDKRFDLDDPTAGIRARDHLKMKIKFCTGIKSMIDFEKKFAGQGGVEKLIPYMQFTNTNTIYNLTRAQLAPYLVASPSRYAMNGFRMGENRAAPTQFGNIDIDWFVDIALVSQTTFSIDLTYIFGKSTWNSVRSIGNFFGIKNPEAENGKNNAYEDINEARAMDLLRSGKSKFSDLWPSSWYQENCGACGYFREEYDTAVR